MAVVIQIDGYDPIGGLPVTLRAGSVDDPRVCHLGEMLWWPAIAKLPTLRYDLFDGSFSAQITAPTSSLTVQTEQWPDFGRYALANARLRLWTGSAGADWAAWTLRFDGRITAQPKLAGGVAAIDFAVDDSWLDAALLATYAGTTGVEGPAELKGQAKPLALGAPRYVAGKLIDSINTVFQVSAYGAIGGVEAALEKLARFSPPVGDRPSYASLVAADIPAGRWATCRAAGLVRFGAPTEGLISFLVQGDIAGGDGWARRPGQLIRRLAILSGGAGRIDDASLNALDAVRPYNLSVYVEEQTTARDLIQRIAASVNAVAGVSWTGRLFVVPIGIAPASLTLSADGSTLPPVRSIEQIAIEAPWQKLAIGAERAWTVHALSDIAFTAPLVDVGAYDPAITYREGNIVSLPDGSRWLYVGTIPAAGHPPTASDPEHWSNLNPATKAGDITYDDGKTLEDLKPAEPGATNSADPNSPFGDGTVAEALATLDKVVSIEARFDPITTDISALKDARVDADAAIGALVDRVAPAEAEISALKLAEQRLTPALEALDSVVADQAAAQRGADEAVGRIEEALLRTLLESARTRDVLRDAGIVVDPASGEVRIFAVDQLKDRTSTAEIAIDAVKSVVSTKASFNQVNELIALAVLDPSQVAELEPIIARLTQAESRIDGLNAAVTLKASVAELTALTTRTRTAELAVDAMQGQIALKANADFVDQIGLRTSQIEQTLTSLPDTAGFVVSVQQVSAVAEDTADALLRTLVVGEDAARYQVTQIAQARQELSTRMVDGFSAAAIAQTVLSVRIDQTTATVLAESQATITRDNAMTRRIDAQGVTLGDQSAAIGDLRTASIDAAGGIASTQMTIRQVIGAADNSDEAMLRALANGEQVAQARAMQLVQIQTDYTTTLVADRAASAAASQAILARMGAAEAAIVTTSKVLADTTGAYGDRLNALEVGFANPITGLAATRVRINAVERASADADEALGERIDTVDAVVNDAVTGLPATRAALVAGLKAAADQDAAFVDQFEQITAELSDPNTGLAATLATVVSNRRAMVEADEALTERIDAQGVALDDQAASIGRLETTSIAAGRGIAATQMTIRQVVSADEDDAEALLRTLAAGEVSNQTRAAQLVQIQTEFSTTLVAGQLSEAIARQILLARIGSAEAAIVTTSKVLADTQRAFTTRQDALEAAFNDAATGLRATSARIVALAELAAEQNRVVVGRLDLMDAQLLDPTTGAPVTGASIAADRKTAADANGATARDLGQLTAKVNDPATGLAKTRAELTSLGEAVASDREASAQSLTEVRATISTTAAEVATAAEQNRIAGEERLQAGLDSNGRAIVDGDTLNAQGIADANVAREAGDSANNQRIVDVDARVTDLVRVQANDNEARAEAIRQVTARLNGNGVTIEEKIEAIVEATGKITGTRTTAIDINGNLVGYKLIGSEDGPGSFNLINTDLKMGTGRIIFRAGVYEKRGGAIFGANNDLAEWFGLATIPLGQETIANSRWAQAADGQSYIGGANIEASVSGPNRIKQVGLNGSTSSSGNATTTITTVSAGFPPNGRFRITGRINSASATNGGGGVAGTWRLAFFVNYGSGPQLIAEAPCSVDPATGAIEDGVLALFGQLFPNPGTGLGNIIVTSTRTGPPSSGISSDWTGSAIFEWVNA